MIFSPYVLLFAKIIGDFLFQKDTFSNEKYKFIIKGIFDRFLKYFNYIDDSAEY